MTLANTTQTIGCFQCSELQTAVIACPSRYAFIYLCRFWDTVHSKHLHHFLFYLPTFLFFPLTFSSTSPASVSPLCCHLYLQCVFASNIILHTAMLLVFPISLSLSTSSLSQQPFKSAFFSFGASFPTM